MLSLSHRSQQTRLARAGRRTHETSGAVRGFPGGRPERVWGCPTVRGESSGGCGTTGPAQIPGFHSPPLLFHLLQTSQSPLPLWGLTAPKHLSVLSNPLLSKWGHFGGDVYFLILFAWREKLDGFFPLDMAVRESSRIWRWGAVVAWKPSQCGQ